MFVSVWFIHLFCFLFVFYIPSMSEGIQYLSFSVWLTLHNTLKVHPCFHKGRISLFFLMDKSVSQFSHSVVADSLWPHGLQHTRPLSPTSEACSNSCPLSSVIPFSSCLQSFPSSGFFPLSQFFSSGGQSIGVSASASVLHEYSRLISFRID